MARSKKYFLIRKRAQLEAEIEKLPEKFDELHDEIYRLEMGAMETARDDTVDRAIARRVRRISSLEDKRDALRERIDALREEIDAL